VIELNDALDHFRFHAADALLAFDFDGTLSPIVETPDSAAPFEGVPAALERLAARFGEVAVVSGRPVEFLERWFPAPSAVTLVGLYGLELRRDGERQDHETSGVWRETIADVAGLARLQGPDGMDVELKGLSLTLHYRRHPEAADAVRSWAEEMAGPTGLRARSARMSVELHPPIAEDKGTVLHHLVAAHTGPVLFAGDDVGDIPALDALGALRDAGRTTLGVVVMSDEITGDLVALADVMVEGPRAVADMVLALAS